VAEKANISHGVSEFKTVPEKIVQELGISHHGGYVSSWKEPSRPSDSMHRLNDPQRKKGGKSLTFNWVDGREDEHAFATFNFKYRSLGRSFHNCLPRFTNTQL
jgi:hypothetical protein